MKSEAHGRLYVIISGSLKPDREWLSWMVIVTLPPWETRHALGLLHRDIQSYSLLHIMELSSQLANGSDPFNLCQKHTDEEVPNARPLPWGRHTPPPGCSIPAAWFIDWCSSLILIHCSVWGDREACFLPLAPHATAIRPPLTRTQPAQQTQLQDESVRAQWETG